MQGRMEPVNCTVHGESEEELGCVYKNAYFYLKNEHLLVLDKPEKIDAKLKIDNRYEMAKGDLRFEI